MSEASPTHEYVRVDDVVEGIKKLGLPKLVSNFYQPPPERDELYQGDIVTHLDAPLVVLDHATQDLVEIETEHALLISNTCDMQPGRREFSLACPIRSLNVMKQQDEQESLMKFRTVQYFYLPESGQKFPGGFVDFTRIVSVHCSELNRVRQDPTMRVASLSQYAFYVLLMKIALFFNRPDNRFANLEP